MSENDFLASITVRMSVSMVMKLNNLSGKGKKYIDRSDAIRSLIALGCRLEDLLEIYNDPEKAKEFEAKLTHLFKEKEYSKTLETMSDKELSA